MKEMILADVLEKLSSIDQDQIAGKLNLLATASGIGHQAVSNFRNESRLSADAWRDFLRNLLATPFDSNEICRAITHTFRHWTLRGPEIQFNPAPILGRAVTTSQFCRFLVELGYFATPSTARSAVRAILNKPVMVVYFRWGRFELGRFARLCPEFCGKVDSAFSPAKP